MNIKLITSGCVLVAVGLGIVAKQNTAIAQDPDRRYERTYGDDNSNVYVHDQTANNVAKLKGKTTIYRDRNNALYVEGNDSPVTVMSESQSAYEQYRAGELKLSGANVPNVVNVYPDPKIHP